MSFKLPSSVVNHAASKNATAGEGVVSTPEQRPATAVVSATPVSVPPASTTPASLEAATGQMQVRKGFTLPSHTMPAPPPVPPIPQVVAQAAARAPGTVTVLQQKEKPPVPVAPSFAFAGQPLTLNSDTKEAFLQNIQLLHKSMDKADVVGTVLRTIMVDLQRHPEFASWMLPEDCGAMVRALRVSYGVAVEQKQAKKRPRKPKDTGDKIDMSDLAKLLM